MRLSQANPRQSDPIIVRVVEQPVHETSISDVILGSLGLVGVLLIAALLCGAVLGGALIAYKRLRARDGIDPDHDAEALRVTPTLVAPRTELPAENREPRTADR